MRVSTVAVRGWPSTVSVIVVSMARLPYRGRPGQTRPRPSQLTPDPRFGLGLLDLMSQVAFQRRPGPAAPAERQHGPLRAVLEEQRLRPVDGEGHERQADP